MIGYLVIFINPAFASTYEEKRIEDYRNNQKNLENRKEPFASNEFILLSLNPGASISEILIAAKQTPVQITAIHHCAVGGRVTAFPIDSNLPLMQQLTIIVHDTMPSAFEENQCLFDDFPAGPVEKARAATKKSKEKNNSQPVTADFCGIETKLEFDKLAKFKSFFKDVILTVELINARRRMLALNVLGKTLK